MTRRLPNLLAALSLGLGVAWSGCGEDESGKAPPPREEIYDAARQQVEQSKQALDERITEASSEVQQTRAEAEKRTRDAARTRTK